MVGNSPVGAAVAQLVPIDRGPGIGGAAVPARFGPGRNGRGRGASIPDALEDELDWIGGAKGTEDRPPKATIDRPDIAAFKATGILDGESTKPAQVVHATQDPSIGSLGDPNMGRVEPTERVTWQPFRVELVFDEPGREAPDGPEGGHSDIGSESREHGSRMSDKEALATIEPEQIHVPVVVMRSHRRPRSLERVRSEKLQDLRRAAQNHRCHRHSSVLLHAEWQHDCVSKCAVTAP